MAETGWLGSTIALVRQAWSQAPEPRSATRKITTVEPAGGGAPGWFRVMDRLTPNQLEYICDGQLVHGDGPRALMFDVLEVAVDGEQVRVRASVTAPQERLSLSVQGTGLRRVLQGLAEGLEASRSNSLLKPFAERRLTPILRDRSLTTAHGWQTLKPAQRDAVAACCSTGLQLVWGPPGTGKTHVIATAISHLAGSGRRVLLVSNTNIAVDTALHQALRIVGKASPGLVVRVGNIHLPELADNDQVRLDRLVEMRQAEVQGQVNRLAAQLEELADAGTRLADAQDRLAGFDPRTFQRAAERVTNLRRFDQVRAALVPAEADLGQAQAEARHATQLQHSLACREATAREAEIRQDLAVIDAALASHHESSLLARARRPGTKGKLTANRTGLLDELTRATAARRQAIDAARRAGADPTPAGLPDTAQIAAIIERVRNRLETATGELNRLKGEAERLTNAGLATPADETLVATERHRWQLHQALPDLRAAVKQADRGRRGVQLEYDQALKRLRNQKQAIQKEIVSGATVVATTLTQLALRPWLAQAPYDHVIVDEAAAASLPHLVHAVGCASTGAVLVGDYLQNGPIVEQSFPGGDAAQKLFRTDCFSHFHASDPQQAQHSPGCVVLTEQFRFGPALTELANRVAYQGILTTAGHGDADIIVVTADGLPEDVTAVHRAPGKQAGWWLIGALLARALAEYHNDSGARDAVGVVVPYVAQVDATRAALEDSSLARLTPVGTSHAFQGRQFDTVLADLVEDGRGRMPGANLRGAEFDVDSVRLFNVAATRPRSRLYVLVGSGALEKSRNGPLAALREMVATGGAHRVDADSLLGMFDTDPPPPDSPEADLVAALAPYVRIDGLYDEDAAIDEVITRVDAARHSVWCWSAWVGKHAEGIIGALERARLRGVNVHVVARPEREVQGANRDALRLLVTRIPDVVFMQKMHQKIVVVDRQWSIVGSMNLLSHGPTSSRRTRDLMVTMDGARFADRLLRQEMADELAKQQRCPTCNEPMTECALVGSGVDRGWVWTCRPPCTGSNGRHLPFSRPNSHAGSRRNDRRGT